MKNFANVEMIMLKCKKIFQKKSGGKKMIHILHGRNVYHFFLRRRHGVRKYKPSVGRDNFVIKLEKQAGG